MGVLDVFFWAVGLLGAACGCLLSLESNFQTLPGGVALEWCKLAWLKLEGTQQTRFLVGWAVIRSLSDEGRQLTDAVLVSNPFGS